MGIRTNEKGLIEVSHPSGGWVPATTLAPSGDGLLTRLIPSQQSLLQAILGAIQAIVPTPPQPTQVFRDTFTEAPLIAAGVTASRPAFFSTNITFQLTISGTAGTTVVRTEGSLDGNSWFTLGDDTQDITYTANGTYAIASNLLLNYTRVRVVSMPSGATVSAVILVGGTKWSGT